MMLISQRRRVALACVFALPLAGCMLAPVMGAYAQQELLAAVLRRLEDEAYRALQGLAAAGSFEADPQVHIALPRGVRLIVPVLLLAGLEPDLRRLEHQINQTAEQVAAVAFPVYSEVIHAQQWQREIQALQAGWTSPTDLLRTHAQNALVSRLRPMVQDQAQRTGLDQTWREIEAAQRVLDDARGIDLGDVRGYVAEQLVEAVSVRMKEALGEPAAAPRAWPDSPVLR